jgi:phosphatidylglycerol---prolipoprotein diacylglyceryl transferase
MNQKDSITPRRIAIYFALFVIILAIALYRPLQLIFAGSWKLQQQIQLFDIGILKIGSIDWNFGGYAIYLELPIGIFTLRYYSLLILCGVLAGYWLTTYLAKLQFIATTIIDRLLIGLLVFGLLGARLLYVVFNWDKFAQNPINIIASIQQGGLAIFGAILGGLMYLYLYTRRFRFNFYEFLDILTPGLLLGQIIGRWGNFFNYEAYGQATAVYWKMFVPELANVTSNLNDKYFHPTFLYEIIPNSILFVFLMYNYSNLTKKNAGLVFAIYAIVYGLIRACVEFFRLDALTFPLPFVIKWGIFEYPNLLVSQFLALCLMILGLTVYYFRSRVLFNKRGLEEIT